MSDLQKQCDRVGAIVRERNWKKNWASGGCYIHLEVSEFIESLRGKGKSSPAEEAGDVLVSFFAVLDHYKIPMTDVLSGLEKAISDLEGGLSGRYDEC
jgi:NTP pyrophosphatase (non-canonical NTP hydrolase)